MWFSMALEKLLLRHKFSQGYSPAGKNAGSLTPFEMTYSKNDAVMKKSKMYHYQKLAAKLDHYGAGFLQRRRRDTRVAQRVSDGKAYLKIKEPLSGAAHWQAV